MVISDSKYNNVSNKKRIIKNGYSFFVAFFSDKLTYRLQGCTDSSFGAVLQRCSKVIKGN